MAEQPPRWSERRSRLDGRWHVPLHRLEWEVGVRSSRSWWERVDRDAAAGGDGRGVSAMATNSAKDHDSVEWNENLVQLLGAYFHDDWEVDHPSAEDCLDQMLAEAPLDQQRRCAAEIARLLDGRLCENQILDVLLYEAGCAYAFESDGFDASSWLSHVRNGLRENVARRGAGRR